MTSLTVSFGGGLKCGPGKYLLRSLQHINSSILETIYKIMSVKLEYLLMLRDQLVNSFEFLIRCYAMIRLDLDQVEHLAN